MGSPVQPSARRRGDCLPDIPAETGGSPRHCFSGSTIPLRIARRRLFAADLAALVTAARFPRRGEAAVVITGSSPTFLLPGAPLASAHDSELALGGPAGGGRGSSGSAAAPRRGAVLRAARAPTCSRVDGFHPNMAGARTLGRGDCRAGAAAVGRSRSAARARPRSGARNLGDAAAPIGTRRLPA